MQITTNGSNSELRVDVTGSASFGAGTYIALIQSETGLTDEAALVSAGKLLETSDLVERVLARIKRIEPIKAARVATTVEEVDISDAGVSVDRQIATRVREAEPIKVLPDFLPSCKRKPS